MSQISFAPKTSTPDWMADQLECSCQLPMCPMCDPDFYYDMSIADEATFMPDDLTPPF